MSYRHSLDLLIISDELSHEESYNRQVGLQSNFLTTDFDVNSLMQRSRNIPQIQGVADMILIRPRLVQCYDNIVATTKLCSTLVVVSNNLLPKVKHTSFQFLRLYLVGP